MKLFLIITLASLALTPVGVAFAREVKIPILFTYPLLTKVLISQFYTSDDRSAELWHDQKHCSFLRLADPRISEQDHQLHILNNVNAHIGAVLGGQCVALMQWQGILETLQKPILSKDRLVLSLVVTQATTYDKQGHPIQLEPLQALLSSHAMPWLSKLQIDLKQSHDSLEKTIKPYLPPERLPVLKKALDTLMFTKAETNSTGVAIEVNFKVPQSMATIKPEAPLSELELAQWQNIWDKWQTSLIQTFEHSPSPKMQGVLVDLLARANLAFQAGLTNYNLSQTDPVITFFTASWQQFSPLLIDIASGLPQLDGLHSLSFLAATDLIYALENHLAPFGLTVSSDSLRRVVRKLLAEDQHAAVKI